MTERMRRWNRADWTLFLVAAAFLAALALHLASPCLATDGLLFVSEAALVGGIADWFAVTALFRRPLGIPWHTAILPRRRRAFINSTVAMVQKEFFSRRKIFRHLGRLHLMPMLMDWLERPATREMLLGRLLSYARSLLLQQDPGAQAAFLAGQVRRALLDAPARPFLKECGEWIRQSGRDREALARIAAFARTYAERPETRKNLEQMLEAYAKERVNSPAAILMAGLAQFFDLVNFEEAAALLQRQMLAMIDELGSAGSPLQQEILALFYEKAAELGRSEAFGQLAEEMREDLVAQLPLEEAILRSLEHIQSELGQTEEDAKRAGSLAAVRSRLLEVFAGEYSRAVRLLRENDHLQKSVEHFLYGLIARSALHAQTLVGVIAQNVLERLTDEQLNRLVEGKAKPDLLWIRMNGSIVGAAIGLALFLLMQAAP